MTDTTLEDLFQVLEQRTTAFLNSMRRGHYNAAYEQLSRITALATRLSPPQDDHTRKRLERALRHAVISTDDEGKELPWEVTVDDNVVTLNGFFDLHKLSEHMLW